MVVGAPSRCTRYTHASDGSAWSSGERGSIAEARFEPKQDGRQFESERFPEDRSIYST